MDNTINIDELMNNFDEYILIDLRSPIEYEESTIPNAYNIPLLDNEARKIIGTIYKSDRELAYKKGIEIGSRKLPEIYEEVINIQKNNNDKTIVFFCFRGGTRSKSVNSVMSLMKVSCLRLDGGYKVYRKYISDNLEEKISKFKWIVLTGNTGVGKTKILNMLKESNYPILDLEGIANNRGSIFGSVGLGKPTNQKIFESELYFTLDKYKEEYIFIESESKKIGNVILPNILFDNMKNSSHILIKCDIKTRINNIKDDYLIPNLNIDRLKILINKNQHFIKYLGKEWVNNMICLLSNNEFDLFIERMLIDYYDKLYLKSHLEYKYDLVVEYKIIYNAVEKIRGYYDKKLARKLVYEEII